LSRVHWVRPELVAEVKYLTWTDENLLRQVVYQGLREDKPAAEVRRPLPHAKSAVPESPAVAKIRRRPKRLPVPPESILQLLPDAVAPSREELAAYWNTVAGAASCISDGARSSWCAV